MKKKIITSLVILIVAIICCGCNVNNKADNSNCNTPQISYNQDEENDITPIVYITKSGKCYHRFGCTHAKNVYTTLTVKQAIKRGYTACYYCCF